MTAVDKTAIPAMVDRKINRKTLYLAVQTRVSNVDFLINQSTDANNGGGHSHGDLLACGRSPAGTGTESIEMT